jgi:hypothetical protein
MTTYDCGEMVNLDEISQVFVKLDKEVGKKRIMGEECLLIA